MVVRLHILQIAKIKQGDRSCPDVPVTVGWWPTPSWGTPVSRGSPPPDWWRELSSCSIGILIIVTMATPAQVMALWPCGTVNDHWNSICMYTRTWNILTVLALDVCSESDSDTNSGCCSFCFFFAVWYTFIVHGLAKATGSRLEITFSLGTCWAANSFPDYLVSP